MRTNFLCCTSIPASHSDGHFPEDLCCPEAGYTSLTQHVQWHNAHGSTKTSQATSCTLPLTFMPCSQLFMKEPVQSSIRSMDGLLASSSCPLSQPFPYLNTSSSLESNGYARTIKSMCWTLQRWRLVFKLLSRHFSHVVKSFGLCKKKKNFPLHKFTQEGVVNNLCKKICSHFTAIF